MKKNAFLGLKVENGEVEEIRADLIKLTWAQIESDERQSKNDSQGLFDANSYFDSRSHVERYIWDVRVDEIVSIHPINSYIGDIAVGYRKGNLFRFPEPITENSGVYFKSRVVFESKKDGRIGETAFLETPEEVAEKIKQVQQGRAVQAESSTRGEMTQQELLETIEELTTQMNDIKGKITVLKKAVSKPPKPRS